MTTTVWLNTTSEGSSCRRDYVEMAMFVFATTLGFLSNVVFFLSLRKLHAPKGNQLHLVVKTFSVSNAGSVAPLLVFSLGSYINCGWIGGSLSCAVSGSVSAIFVGWSVLLIVLLCFYRYLAVVKPFYYRTRLSTRRTRSILAMTFIWSCCHLSLPLLGIGRFRVHPNGWYCTIDLESGNSVDNTVVYLIIGEGVLLMIVLLYLYVALRNVIHKKRSFTRKLSPQQFRGANTIVAERKRDEFANLTFLLAATYWTCCLPYLGYRAIIVLSNAHFKNENAYFYTQMIAYLNSFLSIGVFLVMNKQYRLAMKKWLGIPTPVVETSEAGEQIGITLYEISHVSTSRRPTIGQSTDNTLHTSYL